MKLRALIQLTRNGRTVHPGESFRAEVAEVADLIEAGKAEPLMPAMRVTPRDAEQLESRPPRHLPNAAS